MKKGPYKNREEIYLKAIELRKLGYGYRTIIRELQLNISPSTMSGWMKKFRGDKQQAQMLSVKYSRHEFIDYDLLKTRASRRKFLARERGHKCEKCKLETWLGKPIPLEFHHINGDGNDNSKENAQLLCPNCHSLTPNYRGANKKSKRPDTQIGKAS